LIELNFPHFPHSPKSVGSGQTADCRRETGERKSTAGKRPERGDVNNPRLAALLPGQVFLSASLAVQPNNTEPGVVGSQIKYITLNGRDKGGLSHAPLGLVRLFSSADCSLAEKPKMRYNGVYRLLTVFLSEEVIGSSLIPPFLDE